MGVGSTWANAEKKLLLLKGQVQVGDRRKVKRPITDGVTSITGAEARGQAETWCLLR